MLSKKAQELLDLLTGRKIAPPVGKGQKLIIGDGPARLADDTVAFVKSMTEKPTVAGALTANCAVMHVAKVGGSADLDRGFEKLTKRAPHVPISANEVQGAAPQVAPWGKPRSELGLSDADLRALEDAITTEALTPAEATKRFLAAMKIIRANMGQRVVDLNALNERGRA